MAVNKNAKLKNKKLPNLGPETEYALNLLLIKHSGLRVQLDQLQKVQDKDGNLTGEVAAVVTDYFKKIYKAGRGTADGADVAAAVMLFPCFPSLVVQTQKNRRVLLKVQNFLDLTLCYDPTDPTHPSDKQAYAIFSKLTGVV